MSRLLQELRSERPATLAPLLARCPTLELRAEQSVSTDDAIAAIVLVVEDGIVALTACCDGASRRMIVAIAGSGDLIAPPEEGEELVALTDAALTVVPEPAFRALLASPELAMLLVDRLLDAVHDRQQTIANFAAVNHRDRLRAKLLQLARVHGRVGPDGIHLDLPLTHGFLAQTTGSARETVTFALAALEEEGFLVRENGRYLLRVAPETLAS